jgi:hypothetical protein
MVRISVLNDALKTMYNAEKRGKRQVLIRPSSKVVIKFLQVMQKHGELQMRLPGLFPPSFEDAGETGCPTGRAHCLVVLSGDWAYSFKDAGENDCPTGRARCLGVLSGD